MIKASAITWADYEELVAERDELRAQLLDWQLDDRILTHYNIRKALGIASEDLTCDEVVDEVNRVVKLNVYLLQKLNAICTDYCSWYDMGKPHMDAHSMTYHLVSYARMAIEKANEESERKTKAE